MTVLGVIGLGEAGAQIAAGFASSGSVSVIGYDPLLEDPASGDSIKERVERAGVTPIESPAGLVKNADIVLSLVTARAAVAVAEQVMPEMHVGQFYVDANSASPALMEVVARLIASTDADFVDLAIMAAVSPSGHRVPMLASGPKAPALVDQLALAGARIEVVGDRPGTASAVKMMRSIAVKGIEALMLELVLAAEHYHATDHVLSSLGESFPEGTWRERVDYLTGRTAAHASRRAEEMKEAASSVSVTGIEPVMAAAAAKRLGWAAERLGDRYRDRPPGGYEEVVAELKRVP